MYILYRAFEIELGRIHDQPSQSADIEEFFLNSDLPDLLDSVTIVFNALKNGGYPAAAQNWLSFVRRVLQEEHLTYRLDEQGTIHPFGETEFEDNRNATLAALHEARFGEAPPHFQTAY